MAIIPVAIVAPAVAVFIPPATPLSPATLPLLAQFMPRMVRLSAVPSVILHSFVEPVVGFGNAPLALIVILGGAPANASMPRSAADSSAVLPKNFLSPV
jgi:hypothetical protein